MAAQAGPELRPVSVHVRRTHTSGPQQLAVGENKVLLRLGWCEVGQGDGCDFCVRQFYVPCPSITDSTPHLVPRFTGGAAPGLVSCLQRTA